MKTLLEREDVARRTLSDPKFGPDPVLVKKKGWGEYEPKDISNYKKKIMDDTYLEHAIDKIAMELSHFLSR